MESQLERVLDEAYGKLKNRPTHSLLSVHRMGKAGTKGVVVVDSQGLCIASKASSLVVGCVSSDIIYSFFLFALLRFQLAERFPPMSRATLHGWRTQRRTWTRPTAMQRPQSSWRWPTATRLSCDALARLSPASSPDRARPTPLAMAADRAFLLYSSCHFLYEQLELIRTIPS